MVAAWWFWVTWSSFGGVGVAKTATHWAERERMR
jgi:hypothetical protein